MNHRSKRPHIGSYRKVFGWEALFASIALEGAYQTLRAKGASWSRREFFSKGLAAARRVAA